MNKIKIELSCSFQGPIKLYFNYLRKFFKTKKVQFSIISLPTRTKKITLLKSPHVFKKAKEHFENRTYKKVIVVDNININILKTILMNRPKTLFLTIHHINN
jgi:ribosomal protein S10